MRYVCSNTSHYQSQRHSSYFALNTLMVNVGKWATDTHHATTRLRRTSRAYRFDNDNTASSPSALPPSGNMNPFRVYSTMSTPLPAAAAEAPGSLTALDLEGNRKASVKSAKPDLLSFRPKPGSPTSSAVASPPPPAEETCSKSAPPGGEGVNKGATRAAFIKRQKCVRVRRTIYPQPFLVA